MKNLNQYINEKLKLADVKTNYCSENEYFYHEALEDGYSTWFIETDNVLKYSIDNCKTWHKLDPNTETPEIKAGERIYFKGENMEVMYVYEYGIGVFKSNKNFNVGGNIMSLIYGDDFEDQTELIKYNQFAELFDDNDYLISAKDLILPATKLTKKCYRFMFSGCESLIEAPKLPATELTDSCYRLMFHYCKSLTKTPELPATKLAKECYYGMFDTCSSLNEITMLATDISADDCLLEWVADTSRTGTFTKARGVIIPNGSSGIPTGWTVKEI